MASDTIIGESLALSPYQELLKENEALRQERDAALADARRYRWLRSAKTGKPISCVTTGSAWRCTLNTVELDAVIDAALAGEKRNG